MKNVCKKCILVISDMYYMHAQEWLFQFWNQFVMKLCDTYFIVLFMKTILLACASQQQIIYTKM